MRGLIVCYMRRGVGFSPEKRRLSGIASMHSNKYLKECCKNNGDRLFSGVPGDRTGGNGYIWKLRIPSEYQETLFHWEVDQALTPVSQRGCGIFIPGSHLDMILGNQLCVVVLWTKWLPKVLSNLIHSMILWSRSKIWARNGFGSWEWKTVSESQ